MLLYKLTQPEIDLCLKQCNFTADEKIYFTARTAYKSNTEIALDNHWSESKTSKESLRVREKVQRILNMLDRAEKLSEANREVRPNPRM